MYALTQTKQIIYIYIWKIPLESRFLSSELNRSYMFSHIVGLGITLRDECWKNKRGKREKGIISGYDDAIFTKNETFTWGEKKSINGDKSQRSGGFTPQMLWFFFFIQHTSAGIYQR